MWRFKACPRCRGDIYLSDDYDFGVLEHCLQCGYVGFPNDAKDIEHSYPEK
jgi:predicted nucleic-acid-binding Zn-ribbon protein